MEFMKMANQAASEGGFERQESPQRGASAALQRRDSFSSDVMSSAAGCSVSGSRTTSKMGGTVVAALSCPEKQVHLLEFRLIRGEAHLDVGTASAIGDNAIRLINGAATTRHTFQAIRHKMEHANSVTIGKVAVFGFGPSCATLHMLRKRVLEAHSCIQDAFNAFNVEQDGDLDKREWCGVLSKEGYCKLGEARAVYDLVDADHDGTLTPIEFQVGIEIIAPVLTVEAFRKRLVCLGFGSIIQAITVMNGSGPDRTVIPLSFEDFTTALKKVHIVEVEEHKAIFNAVRDPAESSCRASLSDLACALAVASPCLLLEDLCMRMAAEHGSLEEAVNVLSPNSDISLADFKVSACKVFHLTDLQAERLFRSIDLDSGGEVSQDEIRRALNLAAASLDLEDVRWKLRQGYKTIEAAFRAAYAPPEEEEGLPHIMYFKADEFADVLAECGLGKKSVTRLVNLMGVGENGVTLPEFFAASNLFAPSCALEELKMKLIEKHGSVESALRDIKDKRAALHREAFMHLLETLGVQCAGADRIFDFLDIRTTGMTTVSEMSAALQCLQTGGNKVLSPSETKANVKQHVGKIFEPALRMASELKAFVAENASSKEKAVGGDTVDEWADPSRDNVPHNLQARQTFLKINSTLQVFPPVQKKKNVAEIASYFGVNENVLSEQRSLTGKNAKKYHRHEEHRIAENLKKSARPKPLKPQEPE
jgi:Ca2+-binding EF-hand superfamily protein